jgi:hypothetical protein
MNKYTHFYLLFKFTKIRENIISSFLFHHDILKKKINADLISKEVDIEQLLNFMIIIIFVIIQIYFKTKNKI